MVQQFYDKQISSIVSILPKKIVSYSDEVGAFPFPESQSIKLGKVMGYNTRRIGNSDDGIADYALQGINYLINQRNILKKDDIEAIVVVSSSQDYIIPYDSYIIQGKLNLSNDVLCFDINQACGGYIVGLIQSFMLIDVYHLKKVLLITGDMLSKKVGQRDRSSRPIIGDAVNVSIIEPSKTPNRITSNIKSFGKDAPIIQIPAGGMKILSNENTKIETMDEFGNYRSLDQFFMDGEEVFNFVMREVPPLVNETLTEANVLKNDIDYFLFHQPNRYMVQKLADEMEVPYEKIFSNIVGIYGNSSTGTIPLNICHNIPSIITKQNIKACLSGFGAGLMCDVMVMDLGPMEVCDIIEYDAT